MAAGDLKGTLGGSATSTPAGNVDATGSVSVVAGDLIVVEVAQTAITSVINDTVTDNLGSSYSAVTTGTVGGATGRLWWAITGGAGTLTTVHAHFTTSSGRDVAVAVAVHSAPFTASPLGVHPADAADSVSPFAAPASGTLPQAQSLVVVGMALSRGQTDTAATSPNLLAVNQASSTDNSTGSVSAALGYQIVSSTSSIAPEFTATGTVDPGGAVLSLASFNLSVSSSGTGALSDAAATVSGAGTSRSTGSGALAGQSATISASGVSSSTGIGALPDQSAIAAGSGTSASTGSGSLVDAAAVIAGSDVQGGSGSGALADGSSTVAGSGTSSSTGTGTLADQAAAVSASGASQSTGTGAIVDGEAQLSGVAVAAYTGTGALVSGNAAVSGVGDSAIHAVGAIASAPAAVSGTGTSASTGSGALGAQPATIIGSEQALSIGTGALVAGSATIRGVAIAAIAQARPIRAAANGRPIRSPAIPRAA